MKVLVTGAGGYLGRRLCMLLKNREDMEVYPVLRPGKNTDGLEEFEDRILYADFTRSEDLSKLPSDWDCIYHLAAALSGSHFELMLNTVVATDNLMNAMKKMNVKRFVLVSSFSVYRMTDVKAGSVLDETCPVETRLHARDSYSIAKVRQERIVQKACKDLKIPYVMIRPGKIFGPNDAPIPPQMGLRIPGICFFHIGGGNVIPLTHVDNCAKAIMLAGIKNGIDGEAINIVDDDLPTQKDFLKWYTPILGKIPRKILIPYGVFVMLAWGFEIATKITKGNIPPIITRYRAANLWKPLRYTNAKAKRILGWTPNVPMKEGVIEMLETNLSEHAGSES